MSINSMQSARNLSALFADAAKSAGGAPPDKFFEIRSALESEDKRIKLKGPDVEQLLAHVEKLPAAEKAKALETLDLFRDRFEFVDAQAASKKFFAAIPHTAEPLKASGRTRTVNDAINERAAAAAVAKPNDIKQTDAALDNIRKAGGPEIAAEAAQARKAAFDDGDVKASPEARKDYVQSTAKQSSASESSDSAMRMLDDYERSPFFEDRLMAFLMKHGVRFQKQMNEAMSKFDDPARLESIKTTFNDAAKKMSGLSSHLSPDGKARVARNLADFLKTNPDVAKELPAYQQWVEQAKALPPAGPDAGHEALLESLPPADNTVLKAMEQSDRKEVREYAAVFKAAAHAEKFESLTPDRVASMSEDDLRKVHGEMKDFASELKGMRSMLPADMQQQVRNAEISELPPAIDPTSRQLMFQQINMMTQQYQQIMQALSEIMNKMNEMAMDPIRKMGR